MNAIQWELINRINSGKFLKPFTMTTTIESGPEILPLSTSDFPAVSTVYCSSGIMILLYKVGDLFNCSAV